MFRKQSTMDSKPDFCYTLLCIPQKCLKSEGKSKMHRKVEILIIFSKSVKIKVKLTMDRKPDVYTF